ncbi:hypothetical protein L1987_58173 [Smallanthus sonchifolius]|uniref:Uncharacterized protein n=1 Tax=Smallanthus sonchifolius TaxID=185202 RepID=A0ACB9DET1_9ASTR|nr:hypothetical protein L1987_58173 [Smallanthus sonchifolius]
MAKVLIMRMLMGFAAALMLLDVAAAANYFVGGPTGVWDLTSDLSTWASDKTFRVGDNIGNTFIFANYDSCGTGNPISTSVTSPTRIALTASGTRYFICGRGTHCSQGMKLQIDVVGAPASAPVPAPPQTPTPSSPTPPTSRSPPPQTTTPPSPTPPTSDSPPPPPPTGETVNPPSSAITLKMTAGTIIGFGFLVMMLLYL